MLQRGGKAVQRRRGAVAVLMAVMLPVLLGAAGLAMDVGTWQREEIRLQLAADAAAMGAGRLLAGQSGSTADFQAAALAEANAATSRSWVGTLNQTPTVSVAANWTTVTVSLTSQANSYFSKVVGVTAPTLHASATSGFVVSGAPCVLALNGTASSAIAVNNMGHITATGCPIFSDSSDVRAIYLNSGSLVASSIGAVGTVAKSNSGSNTMTPAGISGQAAEADPFATTLHAPTAPACNNLTNNFTAYRPTPYAFTQAKNVWCGNVTIGGNNSTDTFEPGVYYVVNGNLTLNNASITQAQGVSFVLTGSTPGAFSWTNYSGNTTAMTAPTTGATAGVLVWQTCSGYGSAPANTMAGGSTLQFTGQFYAPCGALNISNNAKLSAAPGASMGVVVSTLSVIGSGAISATGNSGPGSVPTQLTLLK